MDKPQEWGTGNEMVRTGVIRWVILWLLFTPALSLRFSDYRVEWDIGNTVYQTVTFTIINDGNSPISVLAFPVEGAENVVGRDSQGELAVLTEANKTTITLREPIEPGSRATLSLGLVLTNAVSRVNEESLFFQLFAVGGEVDEFSWKTTLPMAAVVSSRTDPFYPREAVLGSTGQRITLEGTATPLAAGAPVVVSVYYHGTSSFWWLAILAALVAAGAAGFWKLRKDKEAAFLKGFNADERKVVERLKTERTIFQNTLRHELQFSRPKMTRLIKSLEAKGVLRREGAGKRNKLVFRG